MKLQLQPGAGGADDVTATEIKIVLKENANDRDGQSGLAGSLTDSIRSETGPAKQAVHKPAV